MGWFIDIERTARDWIGLVKHWLLGGAFAASCALGMLVCSEQPAASQDVAKGRFDGVWHGTGAALTIGYSGQAGNACMDMTLEMSVAGSRVEGKGTRTRGGRTVSVQNISISGTVDDAGILSAIYTGSKLPLTGRFSDTQMTGTSTGPMCQYDFVLKRG